MAVADLPTFGMYSAGKVARDKYHTLLAKETPSVTTLNHEPDPLETDMATEIRNAESLDSNLKPNFEQQLLDPLDSARKLFRILDSNDFESGAHMQGGSTCLLEHLEHYGLCHPSLCHLRHQGVCFSLVQACGWLG